MPATDSWEVDVASRLPNADAVIDQDGWMLLRCGRVPIGHLHLDVQQAGRSVQRLRDVVVSAVSMRLAERALRVAVDVWIRRMRPPAEFSVAAAFDALRETESHDVVGSAPRISVAVCSRDRPQQLTRAINAIYPQLCAGDELLVVLNAPADERLSERMSVDVVRFPALRVVAEPRRGLSWARNRAIAEFRGDVLLFTDDDCVPEAQWMSSHRSLFARNPETDVATGLVAPLALTSAAQHLFEAYGGFPKHYARRWTRVHAVESAVPHVGELGVGANMAIHRRVVGRIGYFDAALGAGTACRAGEDTEYLFRALKAGLLLAHEPRAVVRHEHRETMDGLYAQLSGWSRGFSCAMWRSASTFPEERAAFIAYRVRLGLLHHARRALLYPRLRQLALLELTAMLGSERHYQQARAEANALTQSYASPALDGWSEMAATDHSPRATQLRRPVPIVVTELAEPVHFNGDVECSAVMETASDCEVRLPAHHGVIGADRLADAFAAAIADRLHVGGWRGAVAASQQYLRDHWQSDN